VLAGNLVAYAASDRPGTSALPNHITVRRMRDGHHWRINSTFGAAGVVDWLDLTGDRIVWTDEQHETSDSDPGTPWRMFTKAHPDSRPVLIDSSESSGQNFVPLPRAGDGKVVWTIPAGRAMALKMWDAGRVTTIVRSVSASDFGVVQDEVFYDGPSSRTSRDIFAYSTRTGRISKFTSSGRAYSPAGSGYVVWQEPPNADPESLWEERADGLGGASKIADSGTSGNIVAGDCFAAYLTEEGAQIVDAQGRWQRELAPEVSILGRVAADGKHVTWAYAPGFATNTGLTTVYVATIH